jgi:hypothetical protein
MELKHWRDRLYFVLLVRSGRCFVPTREELTLEHK